MFRTYALRRVKDAFYENRNVTDPAVLQKLTQEAEQNLLVIKRQVVIGRLYAVNRFAMEDIEKGIAKSSTR